MKAITFERSAVGHWYAIDPDGTQLADVITKIMFWFQRPYIPSCFIDGKRFFRLKALQTWMNIRQSTGCNIMHFHKCRTRFSSKNACLAKHDSILSSSNKSTTREPLSCVKKGRSPKRRLIICSKTRWRCWSFKRLQKSKTFSKSSLSKLLLHPALITFASFFVPWPRIFFNIFSKA